VQGIAQQLGGAFTEADARQNGLHTAILNQMVELAALDAQARNIGLTATEAQLAEAIRQEPAFRDPVTGEFDRETYERRLANQGYTPARFEAELQGDLVRGQLVRTILAGAAGAGPIAEALYIRQTETRDIDYLLIQPELVGAPPEPSDSELAAFHQDNAARYTAPEYRAVSLVTFTPDLVSDEIEIDDETVRQAYDFKRADYVKPERRTVRFLTFQDREAAAAALTRLAGGDSFETLAAEQGKTVEEATRTDAAREDFVDPAVAEAAFAAELGLAPEPVEGTFAWSVVEVTAVTPGETTPFEEVREDLREELVRETALGQVYDLAAQFDDALQDGATFAEAAAAVGADHVEIAAVDARGDGPDGVAIETAALTPELLAGVFKLAEGDATDLIETPDGYAAAAVSGVKPPRLKPLEEVSDAVRADWKGDWLDERLREKTEDVVSRLRAEGAFADVAAALGRAPLSRTVSQTGSDEAISPALLTRIFASREGDVVSAPAGLGASRVVAQVKGVTRAEPASQEAKALLERIEQDLARSIQNETLTAYIQALRTDLGETFYQEPFEALFSETE